MNIAVRYYSKGGNTKKIAEAIAQALGVEAETVDRPLDEKTDMVFLGSAVYANGIDESVKRFLRKNADNIGTLYNFSTAAIVPSTYQQVKKVADENGITLSPREFHCKGSFLFLNAGRPNEGDRTRAAAFAKLARQDAE
ncbi:MAG: flavodoxin [Oscillibacter sp.]|nr:flavodoxin [Oscillibacter sp.]